jgi:acyl carrier protein
MNREIIFKRVQDIFRDVFDEDTLIISDKTSSDDIEDWDSLNHILLLSSIQDEFKITISLEEMQSLSNVESLVKIIISKIK